MNIQEPLQLLGGLSSQVFMQRHWEKKPLLIRQAIPGFQPILDRTELLDMAAMDDVESRLVVQAVPGGQKAWKFRHGPFPRKSLPPFKQRWTVLVRVGLRTTSGSSLMTSSGLYRTRWTT